LLLLSIFVVAVYGDGVEVFGYGTGMHIVARFRDTVFTDEIVNRLRENGVALSPDIERVAHIKGEHLGEIPLGYTNLTEGQITEELGILKRTLEVI
jgi:GntR family transcriptional regulator/MocR family aminotransferase